MSRNPLTAWVIRVAVASALSLAPCVGFPYFYDSGNRIAELDKRYDELMAMFGGACPSRIQVTFDEQGRTSMFNHRTATIVIARSHVVTGRFEATAVHEATHLCMAWHSSGATVRPEYRFLDEGFATFVGDSTYRPYRDIRRQALITAKKYLQRDQISFSQVRNWGKYFGNAGQGGQVGWEAYQVGLSFYLFIAETYGQSKFMDLVREIGRSFSFNAALRAVLDKDESAVESDWTAYIRRDAPHDPI